MRAISSAFRVLFAACLAALLASTGAASAAVTQWAQATSDLKPNPDVTFGTLPNGLRYAIRHNATPPGEVSMRLVIEAGSMQETAGQEGLAHLIEHMAFRGSTHVPDGEVMKALQRLGLRLGADANAATGQQDTTYRFDLAHNDAQSVDTGLGFLREIGSELTISQDALDAERKVVLAEARQTANPGQNLALEQLAAEFPGHPYARLPIGRPEVVQAATPAQLRAFYDAYYRPERAVVVVVGDIDPAAIDAKIKALFSDWRGRGPAGQDPPPYAPTGRPRTVLVMAQPNTPETRFTMVWTRPYAPEDWSRAGRAEALVRQIGETALSIRINQMKLAGGEPFVGGGAQPLAVTGVARGEVVTAFGVTNLPATVGIVVGAQRQLADQALTQPEIDYVVEQAREPLKRAADGQSDAPFMKTSPVIAQQLAIEATQGAIDLDDQQKLALFDEATKGLTAGRVSQVLRGQFTGEGPIVFFVAGAAVTTDEAGLQRMLASADTAPLAPYAPPKTLAWSHTTFGTPGKLAERREVADLGVSMARFANGVRLTVKPTKSSPGQVEVVVRFGHGRLDQPRDRLDSSDWAMILMQIGGLSDLKASEIGRTLTGHHVAMFAANTDDAFTIGTNGMFGPPTVPTADFELELQYLAATMTSPGWRSDAWKLLVGTTDQNLQAGDATANAVFGQNYRALLHPGDHRWIQDSPQDLAGFTPVAARAFIEPILKNADIEVLVAGDVTPEQAIDAVAKTLGALPKRKGTSEPVGTRVEQFPAPPAQPIALHHMGRADQAIAEVSWPTTDEHTAWADIAPTVILADILRQRVTDRLRTAEGETYTPNGGAEFSRVFPGWGRVSLLVPCKPEDVSEVYAEIGAIAADLANRPVTEDELRRAVKPELVGAMRSQQQNGYWIEQLAGAQTNPDRLEYIRQTLPQLSAVTAADVQRVAKRWLRADKAFRIEVTPAPGPAAASVASR